MSRRLTASVVGGGSGGKLSLSALAGSERFELVAMADINPQIRQAIAQAYPGIRTFASHQEMLAACPTDVVCVSTWPPSHEPITLDALALGLKGILVEKPLGHTAASGRRILQAVKARNLPMAVPHSLLAQAMPLEVIARVRAGDIGELRLLEVQCTRWDIINAGIHWLLLFVMLTGNEPIDHVQAACEAGTRTYRDGMQVETTAVTYVVTQSGVRCVMNTGDDVKVARPGKGNLFRIVGTAGIIELSWAGDTSYWILNADSPAGRIVTPREFPVIRHQRHLEGIADMIETGRRDCTIPEASLKSLEMCEAAYISSRRRCKVTFPLVDFLIPAPVDWDPGRPYSGTGGGRDGRKL